MSDAPEPLRELLDGLSDLAQSLATMVETLKSLRGELIDAVATIDPGAEQAHDGDARHDLGRRNVVTRTRILGALCVGLVGVAFPAIADPRPENIELVAKSDARHLFTISKRQWTEKVRHAVASGMATPLGRPGSRLVGMSVRATGGTVSTILRYDIDERYPSAILFAIAYRSENRSFARPSAHDVVQTVKRQLAPEFHVVGHTDLVEDRYALFLFITQSQRRSPTGENTRWASADAGQEVRRPLRRSPVSRARPDRPLE